MKENKEGNSNQKALWIIGISVIIFLVLLLGSIIGLKITQNGVNKVLDGAENLQFNDDGEPMYYEVWEDGTMENISEQIASAEFILNGVRYSNFTIREVNEMTEISADIENVTDEKIAEQNIIIKLYDANEEVIAVPAVQVTDLEARSIVPLRHVIYDSCVNAAKLELELANPVENMELEVSGEQVSGE